MAISPRCMPCHGPADVIGQRVELPVPADDEDVVVGDGTEGLVVHRTLVYARARPIVAARVDLHLPSN